MTYYWEGVGDGVYDAGGVNCLEYAQYICRRNKVAMVLNQLSTRYAIESWTVTGLSIPGDVLVVIRGARLYTGDEQDALDG